MKSDVPETDDLLQRGREWLKQGQLDKAYEAFQAILKVDPKHSKAWEGLGLIARQRFDFGEAIHCLKETLACSDDVRSQAMELVQLGDSLESSYQLDEAISCYEKALALFSQSGLKMEDLYCRLGHLFGAKGEVKKANQMYQQALSSNPFYEPTYFGISTLFEKQGLVSAAIDLDRKALQVNPLFTRVRNKLAILLFTQGRIEEAREQYRLALQLDPGNVTALWGDLLMLPILYRSEEEMRAKRREWKRNIKKLIKVIPLHTDEEIARAREAVVMHVNFHFGYQGGPLVAEQKLYGSLVSKITQAAYPEYHRPLTPRKRKQDEKRRVGFISRHLFSHAIYRTHGRWITQLDRTRFEIHTFYLNDIVDEAVTDIRSHSDFFLQNSLEPDAIARSVTENQLDVLIYPDVGMNSFTQLLASLRLAPVQCVAIGHPITTGLPTIDYFLSSQLMETPHSSRHYSEKLVRLPNLSCSYAFPDLSIAKRPKFLRNKAPGTTVFVNAQNLLKLLPQRDSIYPRIARQVPSCEFHFIEQQPELSALFLDRLRLAFQDCGLKADDYCHFHPRLPRAEFLGLLNEADVILDSMDWSGFNTTMDSLATDRPVVTLPGPTCRSRHSFAILKRIHLEELIARDEEDYIRLASQLAHQEAFRHQIASKIAHNKHLAFDDETAIHGLEDFLLSV